MKNKSNKQIGITLLLILIIISINASVFAVDVINLNKTVEYTEQFQNWLELSDSQREETMMPRIYDIKYTQVEYYNPLKSARALGSNLESYFCLQDEDVIPENVIVKNQQDTNTCWTFAALSSLETNLALKNKANGTSAVRYNFSERHMEYASSRNFLDGINENNFNRTVGDGGNWYISSAYLTNGTGAIAEEQMQFVNNENLENLSVLQGKTVISQVYDTIEFPSSTPTQVTDAMITQMKNHIKNNGSIYAGIYGAGIFSTYYNAKTGAIYCSNASVLPDHAVSIIGWNDEYPIDNFNSSNKPTKPGAWIVKNSWGTEKEYDALYIKGIIFENLKQECIELGYTEPALIPNEILINAGFTIDGDKARINMGNNGIMYVSYEDVNIYSNLAGIVKASDFVDYENIYQYNELGDNYILSLNGSKIYLGNIFTKKTNGTEYLTQVGIDIAEDCTCKVYVNPDGESLKLADIELVELKTGASETLTGVGYHTLEFSEPVKINSSNFAVVVEIQGSSNIPIEASGILTGQSTTGQTVQIKDWQYATTNAGKCFVTNDVDIQENKWTNLGQLSYIDATIPNGDSTIKAFTTSQVEDNSLKEIKVTKWPKTKYFVGENFDKTGMEVTAYYNNGKSNIIDGYDIENGTNLQLGQTAVTIKYQDKSVDVPITVEENSIVSIKVKETPTDTTYIAGQDFDCTGMVIEATYKDGTVKDITDYEIVDGKNLKSKQTTVTIKCGEATTTVSITVAPATVEKIEIAKESDNKEYIVGQDFDKTGMIVIATYSDGRTIEITDYAIENGEDLKLEQTEVVIKFQGKTTTQKITVVDKTVVSIQVTKVPDKLQYIQNKENLDLAGGTILAKYNDNTEETVLMTDTEVSVTGFSNSSAGKIELTVSYKNKVAKFEVSIIEEITAKNSNLDNAKCNILNIKSYAYTDTSKEEYIVIELEVTDIIRNLENDSLEYYYYLSANKNESSIENWVKIEENQTNTNKLVFKINTKDISNLEELVTENELYLYIREIAVKGGDQKTAISKSMSLNTDKEIEEYLDDVKQEGNKGDDEEDKKEPEDDKKPEEKDPTTSDKEIPNAGKTVIATIIIITIFAIGIISYKKYRGLKGIK